MDTPLDEHTITEVVKFLREQAQWLRVNYIPLHSTPIRISLFQEVNMLAFQIEQKELTSR